MTKVKIVKYKGFVITVKKTAMTRFGHLYEATNNIGEDYMDIPVFLTMEQAISWDKKNIDAYVNENV